MFAVAAIAVLIALALAVGRMLKGPGIFDRLVAGNATGSLCVLLIALICFLFGRPEFIDLAITYVLLYIIGAIAILKYFRVGDLGRAPDSEEPEG